MIVAVLRKATKGSLSLHGGNGDLTIWMVDSEEDCTLVLMTTTSSSSMVHNLPAITHHRT
jgi:hypothetical protein